MTPSPASPSLTAPLNETEVSELDELLHAVPEDFDPLDVEMLDGFLTAILLQPEVVMPSAWLPFVFDAQGREGTHHSDLATAQRTLELIMRRHNELAAYIAAREPFDPILFELEDDEGVPLTGRAAIAALEPWAVGFMNALSAFPALLETLQADDAGTVALTGILRHLPADADDDSDESREFARDREALDRDLPLADLDEAIAVLVDSVMEVADISRPRRPAAREAPKVGRNDPCPCGSGRKFKHCHGASVH
jgi:uncharacterized protein